MEEYSTQLLIRHIESYVDPSSPVASQSNSLDEVVTLLKTGKLTLQSLVVELEMYLTATDDILRSRGTLLLGETLARISTMTLDDTSIHSLILFFSERLADWKALRGVLVGCLALMRRRCDGIITKGDSKALAISFFDNLQVQSLAQFDRKLCFELLECLLQYYSDAVQPLSEQLVRGIYEAIYEEKDPHCLILVFHIVVSLAELFPDPGGPMSSSASDLFSAVGCYFPIHFTHASPETAEVTRNELSKSLMLAFSCTQLFEPFAIPFLLEKLSSSLLLAKNESLKYLKHCSAAYGNQRMTAHAAAIWSSLKEVLNASAASMILSFSPENLEKFYPNENETVGEALLLLETVMSQNTNLFSDLIANDNIVDEVLAAIDQYSSYVDTPKDVKGKCQVVAWVIYVSSNVSFAAVNIIAARFLPHFLKFIDFVADHEDLPRRAPYVPFFLCLEFLRALKASVPNQSSLPITPSEPLSSLFQRLPTLFCVCNSIFSTSSQATVDGAEFLAVKGMSILATFPEARALQSNFMYQEALKIFIEALSTNKTHIRNLALQALVNIGSFVHGLTDSGRETLFANAVVKGIVLPCEASMPFPRKMEAWIKVSSCGVHYLLSICKAVEEIIYNNFNNLFANENTKISSELIQILNFQCDFFIPRIHLSGNPDESLFQLVLSLWEQIESCKIYSCRLQDKEFVHALTKFIKVAVSSCSVESQTTILNKACKSLPNDETIASNCGSKNEWILTFFASIIIALRPLTQLPNLKNLLQILVIAHTKDSVITSQALGSILNKVQNSDDLLEGLEIVLGPYIELPPESCHPDALTALAWIAKGLLMRGHERVKDAIMLFFEIISDNPLESAMKCAADAFHIMMSDSDDCLNRKFHAVSRPLFKQRLFSTVMPIFFSLLIKSQPQSLSRSMLLRGFSHVICNSPLSVVSRDSNKLIPFLLEALTSVSKVSSDKDIVYGLLLVLSGILTDSGGQNNVVENIRGIVDSAVELIRYPHKMAVRETAVHCLSAMSTLPHACVYRFRLLILNATCRALDDPKRVVRLEAAKCLNLWSDRDT